MGAGLSERAGLSAQGAAAGVTPSQSQAVAALFGTRYVSRCDHLTLKTECFKVKSFNFGYEVFQEVITHEMKRNISRCDLDGCNWWGCAISG